MHPLPMQLVFLWLSCKLWEEQLMLAADCNAICQLENCADSSLK